MIGAVEPYCRAVDKLRSSGLTGYLGIVNDVVFSFLVEPDKSFQSQENEDESSVVVSGKESAIRPSPEIAANGKKAGLGKPKETTQA